MPLLGDLERLIIYAKSISIFQFTLDNEENKQCFEDFQNMIVDPIKTIRDISPTCCIILVSSGNEENHDEGELPQNFGTMPGADNAGAVSDAGGTSDSFKWRVVRRKNQTKWVKAGVNHNEKQTYTIKIPFEIQIAAKGTFQWLLLPFVDPAVATSVMKKKFVRELAKSLKCSEPETVSIINDDIERNKLLSSKWKALKEAYKKLPTDLNLTSLSLFSGPISSMKFYAYNMCCRGLRRGRLSCGWRPRDRQIAWLATGDANLKNKRARALFLKYFDKYLDRVLTLTLPHHGSANSFDSELLEKVRPHRCVVAADQYSNWHHPASSVVHAVFSAGSSLHVTTSNEQSKFQETFVAYF